MSNKQLTTEAVNNFDKCPKMFELKNIRGISKVKQNDNQVISSAFKSYIKGEKPPSEVNRDSLAWAKVRALISSGSLTSAKDAIGQSYDFDIPYTVGDGQDDSLMSGTMDAVILSNKQDHFLLFKVTSKPDIFENKLMLNNYLSPIFLSDSNLEYCIVLLVKPPYSKLLAGEDLKKYTNRIATNIRDRPSAYLLNYDNESGLFGLKYYREEFELGDYKRKLHRMKKDVATCEYEGYYPKREINCLSLGRCEMFDICKSTSGKISNGYKKKGEENES